MRLILLILAIIAAFLGLALAILPLGSFALIPIILAFILGMILFKISKNEGQSTGLIKIIFLVAIIALGLTIYKTIFNENVVNQDIETIQNEEDLLEDAKNELDDLDIDD